MGGGTCSNPELRDDLRFAELVHRLEQLAINDADFERRFAMLQVDPTISEAALFGDLLPAPQLLPLDPPAASSSSSEKTCAVCHGNVSSTWVAVPACGPAAGHYFCVACAERCVEGAYQRRTIRCTVCRSSQLLFDDGVEEITHTQAEEDKRLSFLSGRCPFHDALLIYFCMDCMEPICGKCQSGYHHQHDYDSLDGTLSEVGEELEKLTGDLKRRRVEIVGRIEKDVQNGSTLAARFQSRRAEVRGQCARLRAAVDRREAEMLERLDALEATQSEQAESTMGALLDSAGKCEEHLAMVEAAQQRMESATPMEKVQFIVDNIQLAKQLVAPPVRMAPPLAQIPSVRQIANVERTIERLQFH